MGRDVLLSAVRPADPERDGAACAAVYAPYVEGTAITFEEEAPTADEFAQRIAACHVFLVAETGDEVVGFAYGGTHRARPAYRWSAEVSVYLHPDHRGRGLGRSLYGALFPQLAEQGLWVALAGIALPNPASVALHEGFGFEQVGVYRRIGWKLGAWRDVGWWQKPLREGDGPP